MSQLEITQCAVVHQVGGVAGVRATEHMAITLQPGAGLRMLCRPRLLAAK